jgi:hypothetical protein
VIAFSTNAIGRHDIQGGMNMINLVSFNQTSSYSQSLTSLTQTTNQQGEQSSSVLTQSSESYENISLIAAEYIPSQDESSSKKAPTYTVDMEKIKAMKEDTDRRMIQLFRDTAKNTGLKQLGGIRGILDKIKNGEEVSLEIEYTAEDVEQAKIDVAEGGYWSAEKTSDRLIDFAKALSGGDPAKSEMLKDAFVKAFEEIEDMFGGRLPELSYKTYDMTMEKFKQWSEE